MDVMATRGWGIAISGALIAGLLAFAAVAPERQARVVRDVPAPPAHDLSAPARIAASSETAIVHFRGRGPLARAVRLHAGERVAAELRRQRAFGGLCFDRFANGGVALKACAGNLGSWLRRLRNMRAVARVEASRSEAGE
jgi:hypothetical protein